VGLLIPSNELEDGKKPDLEKRLKAMMKKIGISMAAICAALALAKPPALAAADRDDYNYRPSYQYNQHRRNTYQGYTPWDGYRNDYRFENNYRRNRRDREWREHEWREHERREQRQRRNYRDRDDDYYRYSR